MPELLTVKAMREQLRAPAACIRELANKINAEKRNFTAEEESQWDAANKDYNELEARITTAQRADEIAASMVEVPSDARDVRIAGGVLGRGGRKIGNDGATLAANWANAFQGWMRYQSDMEVSEEQEDAANAIGMRVSGRFFAFSRQPGMGAYSPVWTTSRGPDFQAALSHKIGGTGAYTIPEGFVNSLELAMLQFGGMRQVAQVMTTTSGEPMPWPTANDTTNTGSLVAENTSVGSGTDPAFAAVVFNAYKYTSDFIKVPVELLEDSAFNLAQVIGAMLGERLGRITNTHFTTGTGAARPYGIVTRSTLGKTTASATAIAADELFDLLHSVDPAYRVGPGVGWMWHDNILLALRKLKDGQGRYLWQEGMSNGEPNRLLNYPYTINQDMQSSVATATKTVLFGNLSKYKIRDVAEVRLRRLEERFADTDQVGFVALSRHDGNLLDAGVAPVKHMLQA